MQRITDSPFVNGNPATNTQGTIVTADWLNAIQEELAGTIEGLGSSLIPANNGQLLAALLSKFAPNPTGHISFFGGSTAPTGYLKANGAAVSRTAYPDLFAALVRSGVATISIASPGVVTWAAHGRSANDPIKFTTTGALPTGLVANTTYYVVGASITTNTFQLSATAGGTAINTSGGQSGVHTAINAPWGSGDGSTTFTLPDLRGEFLRGWDDSRGIDASRALGSSQSDAIGSHFHSIACFQTPGIGTSPAQSSGGTSANAATTASGGAETRPRNVALLACIKY